jgi:hypothetical protein
MCLGVPFIAPRQLGAVRGQQGRLSLPFVEWRTEQSSAPPDSHCRRSGADLLPILAQMTVASPGQMAHRALSGAHRTVRCPLPTVGAGHASPADCAADRWLTGQYGAHRTVRCPLPTVGAGHASPADCAADRWLTGQSGAHRTVR